jgi:DtxR family Mn-dependent transcriptional regulator
MFCAFHAFIQIHKSAGRPVPVMYPMRGEDLLEAILQIGSTDEVTIPRLAFELACPPQEVELVTQDLLKEGLLLQSPSGMLKLTDQGRKIAERVARKHQVLQEFLTEMLGVNPEAASQEACRLEHHISDEVTHRLSDYVRHKGSRGKGRWQKASGSSLLEYQEGDLLTVNKIAPVVRRLMDLGFVPGERVLLRRKLKNQAVVVTVKGCDIALSPEVAALVFVEKTA